MALYVNTNVMSLNAQKNLVNSGQEMATSLARLSSGIRINSAADDAAGLAIATKMQGTYLSYNQAVRNANDGISMIQTGESAMNEIQGMMQRMRELSTQAASDTVGAEERGFINNELQELLTEMQNIASRTEFNGANLLDGSFGVAASGTGTLDVGDALTNSIVTAVGVSGAAASTTFTISDEGGNTVRLTNGTTNETQDIDLDNNSNYPLALGDTVTIDFDQMGISVTILASGAVTTTNTAADLDTLTVITTANSDAVVQVGAFDGAANRLSISFSDMRVQNGNATGSGELDALFDALDTYNTTSNQANAQALLTAIDNGLQLVSSERSVLGAKQNRIDYTIANLMTSAENTAAARGRIADTDFAAETSSLTKNQILQQAGVAMLAQANALPQNVLALLQ